MEADISACQSQQPSVMIWAVTRESQRANLVVVKIRMTRTISYDSQGWELEEKSIQSKSI